MTTNTQPIHTEYKKKSEQLTLNMDNGIFNRKYPGKTIGLARSTINNNFTLASNGAANVFRYSSFEPNGGSSSSDISTGSSIGEVHTRRPNPIHEHGINLSNQHERNYRWTVHSLENPNQNYSHKKGPRTSANHSTIANDTNNKFYIVDKSKWTHKTPINGNIAA